eukprot:5342687-Heterocapsa_arctica.AAC.1
MRSLAVMRTKGTRRRMSPALRVGRAGVLMSSRSRSPEVPRVGRRQVDHKSTEQPMLRARSTSPPRRRSTMRTS